MCVWREIYSKELSHAVMEAVGTSLHCGLAGSRSRTADGAQKVQKLPLEIFIFGGGSISLFYSGLQLVG